MDVFSKVFLAGVAAKRTDTLLLSPGLSAQVCYPASYQEKEVFSILVVSSEARVFLFGTKKPTFQACTFLASCQRVFGNCYIFF